jgi:hypothetical protein
MAHRPAEAALELFLCFQNTEKDFIDEKTIFLLQSRGGVGEVMTDDDDDDKDAAAAAADDDEEKEEEEKKKEEEGSVS